MIFFKESGRKSRCGTNDFTAILSLACARFLKLPIRIIFGYGVVDCEFFFCLDVAKGNCNKGGIDLFEADIGITGMVDVPPRVGVMRGYPDARGNI